MVDVRADKAERLVDDAVFGKGTGRARSTVDGLLRRVGRAVGSLWLPAALLVKHFRQHGTTWGLSDDVRRAVEFRELNLAKPWPVLPRMDLVFLRNVMIYFDVDTKRAILGRVARLLRPDGYLLLGGAETTLNLDDSFRRAEGLAGGFYQLVG